MTITEQREHDAIIWELARDAFTEQDRERLIIQEGWTVRDFEHRLREDGFLDL